MRPLTLCAVCGKECFLHNSLRYTSCCVECSLKIYRAGQFTPPYLLVNATDNRDGDGFPSDWNKEIKIVRDNLGTPITISSNKKYTDICPCGIHPSQCEYHK